MLNTISGLLGGGAAPTDYESIATITAGAGGSASIAFTSIPSTYTHLQIRAIGRSSFAAGFGLTASMVFNSDTAANYSWHWLYGDGSAAAANAGASTSSIGVAWIGGSSTLANSFSGTVIDILDYANTNKNKTSRALTGTDLNGSGGIFLSSGNWRSTTAINAITLTNAGNWPQYSSFALYGIK
jgi:hypothetical protein